MNKSSHLFKGNVRRLQALNLYELLRQVKMNQKDKEKPFDLQREAYDNVCMQIGNALSRACRSFSEDNCHWGLGLTYLQKAIFLDFTLSGFDDFRSSQNTVTGFNRQSSSTQ